ncbi:MAG: extracellular solute-binding protein, partial [Rhodospirillaceae bacterium]|nr:extracellular solute-binding protein [Rhodospirillaceae bacterium]
MKTKKTSPKASGIGRRSVLKGAGLGAAALAVPTVLVPRKTRAAIKLTTRDPGGPYVAAMGKGFYEPFNKANEGRIEIVGVAGKHEPTSQIKSMIDTGTYTWDMACGISISAHNLLAEAGYLAPLNIDDDPNVKDVPASFRTEFIQGIEVYTTVLAYRTDVYPAKAPAPTGGFKDLWDVEGIPGRRGLRKHPFDTFEEALMAAGVPGNDVYATMAAKGFDPVFASLDKMKPHVDIWWTGGAQTSQLITTGEVDIIPTWNGRAQAAIDSGAPAAISWNQSLWSFAGAVILRDGPNVDACREFAAFTARPDRQAEFAKHLAYGPTNPNAYKDIAPERAALL